MPTTASATNKVKRTRRTQLELLQKAESSGGRVKKIKFHVEEPNYDSDGSEIPLLQGGYGTPFHLTPAEFLALPPGAVGPNDGVFYGSDDDLFNGPNGSSPDSSYNDDAASDDEDEDNSDDNLESDFFEDETTNGWWTHLDQNGNKLLWFPELAEKVSHNAVCRKCAEKHLVSPLKVSQFTCGIATQVNFECETDESHNFSVDPDTHSSMRPGDKPRPSLYTNNVMAYLLAMSLGVGLEGLSRILGYLSLRPHVGDYESWGDLQDEVGSILGRFANAVVESNIRQEVRATAADAAATNVKEEDDEEVSLAGSFDLCEEERGDLDESSNEDFSVIEIEDDDDVLVVDSDDEDEDRNDNKDNDDQDEDEDDGDDEDDDMGDDDDEEEDDDGGGDDSNNDKNDEDGNDGGCDDGGGDSGNSGADRSDDGSNDGEYDYDYAGPIGITISADAGWQKRAAGCSYSSMSGHLFAVGGKTGLVVGRVVYSTRCKKCEIATKKGQPVDAHRCPKNYEGSSKGMEAAGAVELVTKHVYEEGHYYVETFVSDDDSSMRANLRHSYAALWNSGEYEQKSDCWPRVKSGKGMRYVTDYGKIPLSMPAVSNFLADHAHRTKSFGKAIYALKTKNRSLKISKTDCERLKKSWSYAACAGEVQKKTLEQFAIDVKAVIQHHFNDHRYCGDFCKYREPPKNDEEKLQRQSRFRNMSDEMYKPILKIFEKFTTIEMLQQLHHPYSSQKNESLNKEVTGVAPKDKTFAMTMGLNDRVDFIVVRGTVGNYVTIREILWKMGMTVPDVASEYLHREDKKRTRMRAFRRRKDVRRKRSDAKSKSVRAQLAKEIADGKLGLDYGAGMDVLKNSNKGGTADVTMESGAAPTACKCGATTHKRTSHRDCPLNKKNLAKIGFSKSAAVAGK